MNQQRATEKAALSGGKSPKITTLYYRCKDTRLVVDPVEQQVHGTASSSLSSSIHQTPTTITSSVLWNYVLFNTFPEI